MGLRMIAYGATPKMKDGLGCQPARDSGSLKDRQAWDWYSTLDAEGPNGAKKTTADLCLTFSYASHLTLGIRCISCFHPKRGIFVRENQACLVENLVGVKQGFRIGGRKKMSRGDGLRSGCRRNPRANGAEDRLGRSEAPKWWCQGERA
jgi:hypothetical protein